MRKIAVILLVVAMFFAAGYLQQNAKNLATMGQSVLDRIGISRILPSLSANRQAQMELTYIPATSAAPEGKDRATVYFTDPDAMFLVPVSRVIDQTEYPVRVSLDEFLKGPLDDSGLMRAAPPMTINKVTIANGVLSVDIPQQVVAASSQWGSTGATLALDGILSTCSEQSWVNQVQFLVDGKTTPVIFHGLSAETPFEAVHRSSDGQKAWIYLALYVGNRAYLVPERVAIQAQGPDDGIKQAIELLKQDLVRGDFKLNATVPSTFKVKSVKVQDKMAVVDVTTKSMEAYAKDPVRQSLMVDSLVLTVTTFPGVDKVQFTLDGKTVAQPFGHIDLGRVLSRPRWVNPEP